TLRVVRTSPAVLEVLQLTGFAGILVAPAEALPLTLAPAQTSRWERQGVEFEAHEQSGGRGLDCQLHGHPEKFAAGQLSGTESIRVRFDGDVFGLGLGAFGGGPEDAGRRF